MGEIRIVSGIYRGRKIDSPPGDATRPLLTRLRKSLSDILRPRLRGARVLDLFGGTGAIGFELLSNGAESAVFVELDPPTAALIEANAKKLGAKVRVYTGDGVALVKRIAGKKEPFDIVLVAPPYHKGLQFAAMEAISATPLSAPGGLVVVQRDAQEPFWEPNAQFHHTQTRAYGRTVFDFYEAV